MIATALTVVSAVGAGVVGGVFYAFSTFVMPGLSRLPAPSGIAAMQQINATAVRPGLMIALFGTAATCVAAAVTNLEQPPPRTLLVLVGSSLYLAGAVVLTIGYHVPRNTRLDAVEPEAAESEHAWRAHVRSWSAGNHGRTVLCLTASVLLTSAVAVTG